MSQSPSSRTQSFLSIALVAAVTAGLLGWHIFSHSHINSVDGMYHIRYAWLYWHKGIFTDFPWMQFSIAQTAWADHHFLFHILLIPFTWGGDLIFGLKLAGVFFGTLAVVTCHLYLIGHKVRHAWLYALLLLVASDVFLFRVSMTRSVSLSVAFLVLSLWCIETRRYKSLFATAFFYIWTYQTAVVLLPMAICGMLWRRLVEGGWDLRLPGYAFGGLILGMALNPFSPNTFSFFYFHFFAAFPAELSRSMVSIPEWGGQSLWTLLHRSGPTVALGALVPLAMAPRFREWPKDIGVVLLGTGALLFASLWAQRMLEYGTPFAVLLGARLWAHALAQATTNEANDKATPLWLRLPIMKKIGAVALVGMIGIGIYYHSLYHRHAFDINPTTLRGAATWLQKHTPKDATVYHTDWAGFSYLFFDNVHNRYISGLSPLFFYGWKPKLYKLYRMINAGMYAAPSALVLKYFKCDYLVLGKRSANRRLYTRLRYDPGAKVVYEDRRAFVFALKRPAPQPSRRTPTSRPHVPRR